MPTQRLAFGIVADVPFPEPNLGIMSLEMLQANGADRRAINDALAAGELSRVRRGWYATSDADPDAIAAVRIGGVLTATSASRHYGLWTMGDPRFHVLVAGNASRLRIQGTPLRVPDGGRMPDGGRVPDGGRIPDGGRTPDGGRNQMDREVFRRSSADRPALCLHWASAKVRERVALADPLQTIKDAAHCLPREMAVALADSALNSKLIRMYQLQTALPDIAAACDATCQSGTETLVRVRLRGKRIRVRTQVAIKGVGRVDLLVGERLVIECDSERFHDGYTSERDYDRDIALIRRGYLVLRLKYRHVVYEWDEIEQIILEIVRARRHYWRSGTTGSVISL